MNRKTPAAANETARAFSFWGDTTIGKRNGSNHFTAAKPFSRSAMMSSMCSVPMERRIVFG